MSHADSKISPTATAIITSFAVVAVAVILGGSILGSYLLMVHYVHGLQSHIEMLARSDARQIIAAQAKAAQGRSKSLCGALKQLATTHAAHKLHPVFRNVYDTTSCPQVTGKLSNFHR